MIRAVIIGFAHMHVNEIALYLQEQPDTVLCGGADTEPLSPDGSAPRYTPGWNLYNVAEQYGLRVFSDYRQMLEEVRPDIAYILCENRRKPEVVEECAMRGVNVSIEKPVAASYSEAMKIAAAVRKYGVEAVVNWPVLWRPYVHQMQQAAASGLIGKPLRLRYLNGHTGPLGKGAKHRGVNQCAGEMTDVQRGETWWYHRAAGGGVYLDICCYGCLFAYWILGDGARRVLSYGANLNTPFGDTEDNFAAVIAYPDRMAIIEGTWTTPRAVIPSGPMVVGTEGVLLCTGGAEAEPGVKAYDLYGKEREVPEVRLPDAFRNMAWQYAWHVKSGRPVHPMLTLEENLRIMALLDAAIRANASGHEENVVE